MSKLRYYTVMKLTEDNVYQCLKTVIDPELGQNIIELGLIYGVKVFGVAEAKSQGKKLKITMTLTSPGCPLAGVIEGMIRESLEMIDDFNPEQDLTLVLTFDPPWTPEMMSEQIRLELGL